MHFEISERKILLRFFDVLFVLLSLYIIGEVFEFDYLKISKDNYHWCLLLGAYILFFGAVFEMYNLQVASNQYQTIKSIVLATSSTVVVYLLTPYFTPILPQNRLQILYFFLSISLSLSLWRFIYIKLFASYRFVKSVVLVCAFEEFEELVTDLEEADPHYKVVGFVNSSDKERSDLVNECLLGFEIKNLKEYVQKNVIKEIVVASNDTKGITVELYNQILFLLENGCVVREYTQVYEDSIQRIPVHYMARDFYRYFPFSRNNQNTLYLLVVRFLELLASIVGILFGVLLVPFIILGNSIASRGPLFYSQERVGKNGIPFKIFKFRTMVVNAEVNGAVFAVQNDARITPFGRFLRKTRVDEFPQFINILKGEMGVIGPRPERPVFVSAISQVMPFYETRHVIKPGLTGWAQVKYAYGESIDESLIKLQYDLYYIKHRSIFLDINIMIKTLSTVLFYRGH
jgi:exopolysaccharide biosynthesis polyprenyl glycosylphosphotransferase